MPRQASYTGHRRRVREKSPYLNNDYAAKYSEGSSLGNESPHTTGTPHTRHSTYGYRGGRTTPAYNLVLDKFTTKMTAIPKYGAALSEESCCPHEAANPSVWRGKYHKTIPIPRNVQSPLCVMIFKKKEKSCLFFLCPLIYVVSALLEVEERNLCLGTLLGTAVMCVLALSFS